MSKHHSHGGGCTHCSCNNPVIKFLENKLFPTEIRPKNVTGAAQSPPESILFYGGTIRPMTNGNTDTVEAVGILNGKVVLSGSYNDVQEWMNHTGESYTERQLDPSQTLLPGLIEPHVHLVPTAMLRGWADLGGFEDQRLRPDYTTDWLKNRITEIIGNNYVAGYWFLGREADPALMPFMESIDGGLNVLSKIDYILLDEVSETVPILILSASMHTMYANSVALNLIYNANTSTINGQGYANVNEYITQTQGILNEEDGMGPAILTIPPGQIAEMQAQCETSLTAIITEAHKRGVTFMYDAGLSDKTQTTLQDYMNAYPGQVRVGGALVCDTNNIGGLQPYSQPNGYSDVYLGHVKLVSDGSNQGLTGYQSVPYCCETIEGNGIFNFTDKGQDDPTSVPAVYQTLVNQVLAQGWPMMIHANGDYAVQFAIQAHQAAPENIIPPGTTPMRHRIEHCSIVLYQDWLNIMADLNISPSFLIGHVGYWGYAFSLAIFEEKAQYLDLCSSALQAGLRISLHSDHEVSPLGPLRMMEQSITRIMEGDPQNAVLNEGQCLTAEQALRAVTYDAAWQCYADGWTGSLVTDKFADFVILAEDPLTMTDPYMHMRKIRVDETWVGGVCVHTMVKKLQAQ